MGKLQVKLWCHLCHRHEIHIIEDSGNLPPILHIGCARCRVVAKVYTPEVGGRSSSSGSKYSALGILLLEVYVERL